MVSWGGGLSSLYSASTIELDKALVLRIACATVQQGFCGLRLWDFGSQELRFVFGSVPGHPNAYRFKGTGRPWN